MKIPLINFITFISFLMINYHSYTQQNDIVTINGEIINNQRIVDINLKKFIDNRIVAKTTVDENNQFNLKFNLEKADIFKLDLGNNDFIPLIVKPGESVIIEFDEKNVMGNLNVKGSEETALLMSTADVMESYKRKQDSIDQVYRNIHKNESMEEEKEKLVAEFVRIKKAKIDFLLENINRNPESLSNLFFMNEIEISTYPDVYKLMNDKLIAAYPDNTFVIEFSKNVNKSLLLAIGKEAPDIILPDPDGEDISLSSLKGKVVLIDFWASWCGPCRHENPNVVRIYNKYKEKGFEIYGVSLDRNKDSWLKAIEKDNLSWIHVSDLKFWQSEGARIYGVNSIPFTVLIDEKGKILAKGLRGNSLDTKLAEIFD